jgi:hypothetical protein
MAYHVATCIHLCSHSLFNDAISTPYREVEVHGISQSVHRRATGWKAGVLLQAEARHFTLLHTVQIGSEAHPAPYQMGTTGAGYYQELSPEVKRPGRETNHSPLSSAKVKKGGTISPLPHTSPWRRT